MVFALTLPVRSSTHWPRGGGLMFSGEAAEAATLARATAAKSERTPRSLTQLLFGIVDVAEADGRGNDASVEHAILRRDRPDIDRRIAIKVARSQHGDRGSAVFECVDSCRCQ